jgi:hypothetical protein
MLAQAQNLRGRIYLEDEAIEPTDLTPDGRHYIGSDEESWHLLTMDSDGTVCGCARYLAHENTISFARHAHRLRRLCSGAESRGSPRHHDGHRPALLFVYPAPHRRAAPDAGAGPSYPPITIRATSAR